VAGEALHRYDVQLCDYVVGNISQYLDDKPFAKWVKAHVRSVELRKYLVETGKFAVEERVILQLNDDELWSLMFDTPFELDKEWVAYDSLHRRYVNTLREVRNNLSKQTAEEWARDCAHFGKRLDAKHLPLQDGIAIVQEWLWRLRRLLLAMGEPGLLPYPDGNSPTPTNRTPPERNEDLPETDLDRMRQAIREHANGKKASARALINKCKISNKRGRDTLRILENLGEYEGFAKARAERFVKGRPNER
jgi:hypothetical protein